MKDFSGFYKLAVEIADRASEYLLANFGSRKVITHKNDSHYGIKEDVLCNELYEDFFRLKTPEVSLFTEEGERNMSENCTWVVDPIEGTSNYKAGNPFWATQLALFFEGESVFSIVNAPALNLKFSAAKGKGATLNGAKISPTDITELNLALLDMCRGVKDSDKDWMVNTLGKVIKKVRTNRAFGSSGLQTCLAASGITDIFINSGSQIYDVAPGILIAKESGSSVFNLQGGQWRPGDAGYIVSNQTLALELLKILNA